MGGKPMIRKPARRSRLTSPCRTSPQVRGGAGRLGRAGQSLEDMVQTLTKRLMRHFDGKHQKFLVTYGWEDVARVALRSPRVRRWVAQ